MNIVTLTTDEVRAINSLKRLAKKWPRSLRLFSHAGTLIVTKANRHNVQATVSFIEGIPNDGGDPGEDELDQFAGVEWPQT
jgi:hypothetical protein